MKTLYGISEEIRRCTACPLWKLRTLAVPGDGDVKAKILLVGEAPGTEADRQGINKVGNYWNTLQAMFEIAGLKEKDVFLTSSVKCHPPKNRNPTRHEQITCKEKWLIPQTDLIKPQLIILLGNIALKSQLSLTGIGKYHGQIIESEGQRYFVSYHPAAAKRFPKLRNVMEKDFGKLKKFL